MNKSRFIGFLSCSIATLSLTGCGGWTPATVGGTLTGLDSGRKVAVQINGTDTITLASNGAFRFDYELAPNETYSVAVYVQPLGQLCTVTNGAGTVNAKPDNVNDVAIGCVDIYPIAGTVSGLATGVSVILKNKATDVFSVSANGTFIFPTALPNGTPYEITVAQQPTGQTCLVANGVGTIDAANPANSTNVAVTCTTN